MHKSPTQSIHFYIYIPNVSSYFAHSHYWQIAFWWRHSTTIASQVQVRHRCLELVDMMLIEFLFFRSFLFRLSCTVHIPVLILFSIERFNQIISAEQSCVAWHWQEKLCSLIILYRITLSFITFKNDEISCNDRNAVLCLYFFIVHASKFINAYHKT